MQRAAAIKKLTKLLGQAFGYRVNLHAPYADERLQEQANARRLLDARQAALEALNARRTWLLDADPEHRLLLEQLTRLRDAHANANFMARAYRFTAGVTDGMFYHVVAQGDTWEEVVASVEKAHGKGNKRGVSKRIAGKRRIRRTHK
jgi:hypothetical protein